MPSCSRIPPQSLSLADETRAQRFHQLSKRIALGLRQIGSLTLREHGEQEHGAILTAEKGDDAVTTAFALASARHAHLPASARILHQIAGARVLRDLDHRALALLMSHLTAAAARKARVSMTVCIGI